MIHGQIRLGLQPLSGGRMMGGTTPIGRMMMSPGLLRRILKSLETPLHLQSSVLLNLMTLISRKPFKVRRWLRPLQLKPELRGSVPRKPLQCFVVTEALEQSRARKRVPRGPTISVSFAVALLIS